MRLLICTMCWSALLLRPFVAAAEEEHARSASARLALFATETALKVSVYRPSAGDFLRPGALLTTGLVLTAFGGMGTVGSLVTAPALLIMIPFSPGLWLVPVVSVAALLTGLALGTWGARDLHHVLSHGGVRVDGVGPNSNTGLTAGDVILSLEGEPVKSPQLLKVLAEKFKGTAVTLTVIRDGKTIELVLPSGDLLDLDLDVTLGQFPGVATIVTRIGG